MDNITKAIEILKRGPKAVNELHANLEALTSTERKTLALLVEEQNIPAPQMVFYDYKNQNWLI